MSYILPDKKGYYGKFGGKFVPETLMGALEELEEAYRALKEKPDFNHKLGYYLNNYVGRPSPLYPAENLSREFNNIKIYLKREDLLHTGAHKINNTVGQVLLAKRMGKERIIAETGAGQHGVATATACALLDMECTIYMGARDMKRQRMNVFRAELMGATIIPVESGSATLKDGINQAIRDWVTNVEDTHYCIGSVVGPHPYPMMVRNFQSIIGEETKQQILQAEEKLPDILVACVGGGSNSIGFFYPFVEDRVKMIGVEGGGMGLNTRKHSSPLCRGKVGSLHGSMSYLLQDENGQIKATHSVAPGLDYPGVGPEHSYLKDSGRVEYTSVTDEEALKAFKKLSYTEGIIPALESSHAVAYAMKIADSLDNDSIMIINLSGRGDKDLDIVEGLV